MSYIVPATDAPLLPVKVFEDHYPMRAIDCVGRNYRARASEMGADQTVSCRSIS